MTFDHICFAVSAKSHNCFNFDDYTYWLDCDWCSAANTVLPLASLDRHNCSRKIRMLAEGGRNFVQY